MKSVQDFMIRAWEEKLAQFLQPGETLLGHSDGR